MDFEDERSEWRDKPLLKNDQQKWFNKIFLAGLIIAIGLWIGGIIFAEELSAYNVNLYTNLLGFAVTVGIIEALNQRRANQQLKAQLFREIGSSDNAFALRALRELDAQGWTTDGSFRGIYLGGSNLRQAPLSTLDLSEALCPVTNFEDANMWRINLSDSSLQSANLRKARLGCADLVRVHAAFCLFNGAELGEADLRQAELFGADFSGANLWATDFENASLKDAILCGANLAQANLKGANLEGAKFDNQTRLPDGELVLSLDEAVFARFADPNHKNFWRPKDDERVWWAEEGRPRPNAVMTKIHKSWE